MFCKWCGLESETTDVCSWCRKPFSTPAAPATPAPESTAPSTSQPSPSQPPPARPAPDIDNFDDLPPPMASEALFPAAPSAASPSPGAASSGSAALDSFDDIDDDLSPFPFGGGYRPAPLPPRSAAPPGPPPPTFAPLHQSPVTPPASQTPPVVARQDTPPPAPFVVPPATPSVEAPAIPVARQVEAPAAPSPAPLAPPPASTPPAPSPAAPAQAASPSLEAIPIRLKTPGGGAPPPPVVPIKQSPSPADRTPAPVAPIPASPSAPPVAPPTFRTGAAPTISPAPSGPPAQPPAAPLYSPIAPDAEPAPQPMAARAPSPFGDSPADDLPSGPVDLGLKPLEPEEQDEEPAVGLAAGRRLDLGGPAPSVPARPAMTPASPPSRPAAPSLSKAIGKTWYCRWCGMDSEDPNTCSWCRRDLRNSPAPAGKPAHVTITHGPVRGKPVRQPVAKVKDKPRDKGRKEPLPDLLKDAPKPTTANGTGLPKAAPQLGTFQAAKSKYYGDQVLDPVSGAHYDADTGKSTDTPVQPKETVDTNDLTQLGIYAAVFVVLLALVYGIGTSVVRGSVAGYFLVLAVSSFLAGILLPILRVAPWPKDDSEDVGWALGLIPLFGPFAGTMGYGVLGVVRQDVNPAILGVFITSLLLRVVLDIATGHGLDRVVPFRELSGLVLGAQVMPFVTLAGWYASEMFHKPDE